MRSSHLQSALDEHKGLREWLKNLVETREWKTISRLLEEEAVKNSRAFQRIDADPILARNLTRLDGALWTLEMMESCWLIQEGPPADEEEFSESYVQRIMEKKQASQQ